VVWRTAATPGGKAEGGSVIWLSGLAPRAVSRALAKTLVRLPAALDAQLRRDAGISHFEYEVLALLSQAPGRTLRMSELATGAGSSLPRLSQVVARLEQRDWVRRTRTATPLTAIPSHRAPTLPDDRP
jgi:hypothetical protein